MRTAIPPTTDHRDALKQQLQREHDGHKKPRLQLAIQERRGVCVTPATIWKWLQAEGLIWKRQQSWFQVKVDAAFVEERGPSFRLTPSRARGDGSSVSTNSGP